jgi:hypothetical protein
MIFYCAQHLVVHTNTKFLALSHGFLCVPALADAKQFSTVSCALPLQLMTSMLQIQVRGT